MADVTVTTKGSVFNDKREVPLYAFQVLTKDEKVIVKGLIVENVPGADGGDESTVTVDCGDVLYLDKTTAIALAAAIDTAADTIR
jgi:hypothetical protein